MWYGWVSVENLKSKDEVTLLGDGCCDSPGHSAKYGTYTLMEESSGKVFDTTVVSVTDVSVVKFTKQSVESILLLF